MGCVCRKIFNWKLENIKLLFTSRTCMNSQASTIHFQAHSEKLNTVLFGNSNLILSGGRDSTVR